MQKNLHQMAPPNISPPGGLYLEFALEYKVKQSKNVKFPSHYKLAQSILKHNFPPYINPSNIGPSKNKPLKKGLWKL